MYCQIRLKGQLSSVWSDWFEGLEVQNEANGEAILFGTLPDHSALYAVLDRLQALNLALISVHSAKDGSDPAF